MVAPESKSRIIMGRRIGSSLSRNLRMHLTARIIHFIFPFHIRHSGKVQTMPTNQWENPFLASLSGSGLSFSRRELARWMVVGGIGTWQLFSEKSHCAGAPVRDQSDDGSAGYRVSLASMGSMIEIRWMDGERDRERSIADAALMCADAWVDVLSDYQQDSECMRLCREAADGRWVPVSESLWRVLSACDHWYRLTEGAFDAGLGALTRLRRSSKRFTDNAWDEARARCGWEHVELDEHLHRFRFHRPGLLLDFGAIGKGFVVDRIGERLREIGIDRFVVNASGNMLCGDAIQPGSPKQSGWPISIATLGEPARELKRLRLSGCGIATSGDSHQRLRDSDSNEDTDRSSHIIDPVQRRGLDRPTMATVLTAGAADADALATACCVHLNRGTVNSWLSRVWSELPKAEYVFQSWRDGAVTYTAIPCDW
jgi:thiamine biosynthesis lipoprotein